MNNKKLSRITKIIGLAGILLAVMVLLTGAPAQASFESAATSQPEQHIAAPPAATVNNSAAAVPALATVSVDLCATDGTATMPDGEIIPIWGFVVGNCTSQSGTAALPSPVIEANEGDTVEVTLYNDLAEDVSILFPGQNEPPDMTGVAPAGSKLYSFVAGSPGTFLYESGTNPAVQVPMGLYGALVVHSATLGQAYDGLDSAYDASATLILSEIDPNLNANPVGFNMLDYAPTYWLINGKAYPETDALLASPGQRLLIRYLNPGLEHHTMTLLGADQQVIAMDGYEANYPYTIVSQTIPSGQTTDVIVAIPAEAAGSSIPLYNRNLHITNGGLGPDHFAPGGGMMTFIDTGLNFNDYTLSSYDPGQDAVCGGPVTVEDGGVTLHIVGNCWKKIDFAYPVTHTLSASTVMEFDFKSTIEGEVHGIGFDDDDIINNPIRVFQLYGTQTWGIAGFNDYPAGADPNGWTHYKIPVGQFYTGAMTHLVFANDDDGAGAGESYFRNVQVYDEAPSMLNVNGSGYFVDTYGGAQDANPTVSIEDGGDTLRITGNGWKKVAIPYTVTANTMLEFDFESSVQGEVHGIGFDTDDTISNP
ncbi:MAG: multicopper oxidase domain-containing protein, partial [Chloroflexi bacterium]|nr:multicopper oxidase domain-containing protein [Chloroflexota bacterium]